MKNLHIHIIKCILCVLIILLFVLLAKKLFYKPINNMNVAEILIEYGGWGNERCIFEIKSNGKFVTNVETLEEDGIFKRVDADSLTFKFSNTDTTLDPKRTKQRAKKLSKKEQEEIKNMIKQIKDTGDSFTEEFNDTQEAVTDSICIYANIDNKIYGSFFSPKKNNSLNALQELTYKLVDMSPLSINGVTSRVKQFRD